MSGQVTLQLCRFRVRTLNPFGPDSSPCAKITLGGLGVAPMLPTCKLLETGVGRLESFQGRSFALFLPLINFRIQHNSTDSNRARRPPPAPPAPQHLVHTNFAHRRGKTHARMLAHLILASLLSLTPSPAITQTRHHATKPHRATNPKANLSDEAIYKALNTKMKALAQKEKLVQKIQEMPAAWVLVFEPDTVHESVYSIHLPNIERNIVIAFEQEDDAMHFVQALHQDSDELVPTVQALDLETLVVSSREAEFQVALVLRGDLQPRELSDVRSSPPLIATSASSWVDASLISNFVLSFTMVPDEMFADRSAEDFLDPLEDSVWVLVYDADTSDSQYFSVPINGTQAVVCFHDETAAKQCCLVLAERGATIPTAKEELLVEVLEHIDLRQEDCDVCLVDEVVDVMGEIVDDAFIIANENGSCEVGETPANPRSMLERIFSASHEESTQTEEPPQIPDA